jgi:hypothetical protein
VSAPKRIQLRRTKGWRLPDGAVSVARPTKWGNPYRIEKRPAEQGPYPWVVMSSFKDHILGAHETKHEAAAQAVEVYELQIGPLGNYEMDADLIVSELAGHDLACWCPLDQPCHADVLLEIANGGAS